MTVTGTGHNEMLIIGQGYAGSLLAWMLIKKGYHVTVIDSTPEFTSTKVAAGIMLPITGRRLAKTHLADRILPFAHQIYREIETATGSSFFIEKKVLQVFSSLSNLNEWYARSSETEMDLYCDKILSKDQLHKSVTNSYGGILLKQSGFVEPLSFVDSMRSFIQARGKFIQADFDMAQLELTGTGASWNGNHYSKVIFCEGYHAMVNPYFSYLPFKPAKGEILDFVSDELQQDYIISNSVYILPLGNSRFRTGATYVWDDLTEKPTEHGLKFLTENLKNTINCPFEITGHKAGIRPAIRDRRPLVGLHPLHKQLGILNGLGTKGAMLGPYYANQLALLISENHPPDPDVKVSRFDALYQAS
ncbi:MAG: FAD-binding oxidoreductase [Bacteroidota bacterium]|nr:FAD-binding oxidoreductase [Bacteroidota bacterium]